MNFFNILFVVLLCGALALGLVYLVIRLVRMIKKNKRAKRHEKDESK